MLTFPPINAITSNVAGHSGQGTVQGALFGIRSLAAGMGPLVDNGLFSLFTQSFSGVPYFPQAPFLLNALLILIALRVGWKISVDYVPVEDGDIQVSAPNLGEVTSVPVTTQTEARSAQ